MKIVIVNTLDIEGGAARAAYRLHRALLAEGMDSRMLVQSKTSDDYTVIGPVSKIQKGLGKIRPTLDAVPLWRYKNRTQTLFSPAWVPFSNTVDQINALEPDVVHLHWVAGGMMRIEELVRIKAPIVWTLHDNWAFTGGCHIMWDCEKYKAACGACPRLGSHIEKDLSRKTFIRKRKAFSKIEDITIVGLSNWLVDCAKESALLSNRNVIFLPNPMDVQAFFPIDKKVARDILNLTKEKKLILFGAMSSVSDINKGYKELSLALEKLKTPDAELIVFGASQPQKSEMFSQKAHYLGRLHDDISLRVLYSAADVMVVPSLQENLSNAIMESLACGTPVVSFDIGGNPDLIDHKTNGYLTKPYQVDDLAKGIDWVLQHEAPEMLTDNARQKVLENFDSKLVAKKYIDLYREVLSKEK